MNMQISPASTHSHQLCNPLVVMIINNVCGVRNIGNFNFETEFTAVLRRKHSAMVLT